MMVRMSKDMFGFPYFPGVAVGRLQHGINGADADRIALIEQHDITSSVPLPAGFLVVEAAPFSHTMITLLGLGVPTVLINAQQAARLEPGAQVCIDGVTGRISHNLSDVPAPLENDQARSKGQAGRDVLMADGEAVQLCASVRRPSLARLAVEKGAKAIGLVRTEFLMPEDGSIPDTDYYLQSFRQVCEAASPLPVTFRLLDVAADKIPAWLPVSDMLGRGLGLQGVRQYGIEPVQSVVNAQLDALAELSGKFELRVLIPFLVRVEELAYWQTRIRQQLPQSIPVGAMAETPATVMDITGMLASADFVAIGCNDLMQSLYAADRDQPALRHYLDPYAPMLYRMMRQIATQAGKQLQKVQLCGVLSQIQGVLPILLGLGYRTFSVDAPFIPYLAETVNNTTCDACESIAQEVCTAKTTQQVLEILGLPTDRHLPFLH